MGEVDVGQIAGVFGLDGEVRVHLHHRESALFRKERAIVLVGPDGSRAATRLRCRSGAGGRVIGRLDGCDSPEAAASYVGWHVLVPRSVLPPPEPGEFYLADVIGAPATLEGERIGEVVEVHQHGPVDVFEVRLPGAEEPLYVPAVAAYVRAAGPGGLVLEPAAAGLL